MRAEVGSVCVNVCVSEQPVLRSTLCIFYNSSAYFMPNLCLLLLYVHVCMCECGVCVCVCLAASNTVRGYYCCSRASAIERR